VECYRRVGGDSQRPEERPGRVRTVVEGAEYPAGTSYLPIDGRDEDQRLGPAGVLGDLVPEKHRGREESLYG